MSYSVLPCSLRILQSNVRSSSSDEIPRTDGNVLTNIYRYNTYTLQLISFSNTKKYFSFYRAGINSLQYDPVLKRLYSAGRDSIIRTWNVSNPQAGSQFIKEILTSTSLNHL